MILTSFHGVPKRYLTQGDPYHCFCQKTSRLVKEKLGYSDDQWMTTFQSRFGPEEWLQPYTDKTLESLPAKGIKKVAILSPAFAVDCLETLEELNEENFTLFAIRHYDNPQCTSTEEFYEDIRRFRYLKRLLKRYHRTGELREYQYFVFTRNRCRKYF